MGLWTPEHAATLLPAVVVMIVISLLLRKWLINKSFETRMLPVKVIAVLLLLLEVGKQAVSISRGYDLYHLPFHFCSLFLFMMPAMAFYRGKHQEKVFAITTSLCASCTLLMLIYPSLIYGGDKVREFFQEYQSFHTVLFHNLVVFAFVLILSLDLPMSMGKGSVKAISIFMLVFSVVAAVMSQLLKTNYTNMYQCNIPVFEDLRLSLQPVLGYWVTQGLYVSILTCLHILFVLMCYGLIKLVLRRKKAAV
jgi:uncharacterized membrane protein YwaF